MVVFGSLWSEFMLFFVLFLWSCLVVCGPNLCSFLCFFVAGFGSLWSELVFFFVFFVVVFGSLWSEIEFPRRSQRQNPVILKPNRP